jgi:hypothetical protein
VKPGHLPRIVASGVYVHSNPDTQEFAEIIEDLLRILNEIVEDNDMNVLLPESFQVPLNIRCVSCAI